jgi:hypothetical protein
MRIRIPKNWKESQGDRNRVELVNPDYPNWILVWEYEKEGFCWHVEKLDGGMRKSGYFNFYKNFSAAIKEIKQ